ncbi:MAG: endonuclease/exonuclease/phosphatase family protein [Prevotella sp.]
MLHLLLASLLVLMELNCENLFDCRHDEGKNDTEFLPEGARKWTPARYWHKQNQIARAILAAPEPPALVALCEVENDSVMYDLTRRSMLRNLNYGYFITSSADERGIDVALMYQPYKFHPLNYNVYRTDIPNFGRPARDILYVSGRVESGDTLHVLVVHAPSKAGKGREGYLKRERVCRRVIDVTDSIRSCSPHAHIVVMGDFNENADEASLRFLQQQQLHAVTFQAVGSHGAQGSYRFRGRWERIDHILVSTSLLPKVRQTFIVDAPFMLEPDEKYGGVRPVRTYQGPRYNKKGVSDHLPLVLILE